MEEKITTSYKYLYMTSAEYYKGITEEQFDNRMLQKVMVKYGFAPIDCEWWHFTLEDEPYPDTYFEFPVNAELLRR